MYKTSRETLRTNTLHPSQHIVSNHYRHTRDEMPFEMYVYYVRRSRGGGQGVLTPPTLKNHKNIGFLSNFGPDPLKNRKATEPAFNAGPSSVRQRNAIEMAFRWRADDSPHIVVFGSSHPSSTKKKTLSRLDPLW